MKMQPVKPILIVDDDKEFLASMELALLKLGYSNFIFCSESRDVPGILGAHEVSIALFDITMPHLSGTELLAHTTEEYPDVPVIMITANIDIRTAVDCMKAGAYDYLVKPADEDELDSSLKRALEKTAYVQEISILGNHILSPGLDHPEAFSRIITNDPRMISIFRYVEAIAASPQPVIITGETGTGKELIAQVIHELSGRTGEFVGINIAAFDDSLFSDELFGHKKGAYTGADSIRKGLVDKASGGSLFLDEIGDLCVASQLKLLRLIQENEYYKLGSDTAEKSDVRIVAATNCNLEKLMAEKKFRIDLYHRLRIHRIALPPLRKRPGDLPLLIDHFIREAAELYNKQAPDIDPETIKVLASYHFRGNVRELKSILIEAVCLARSKMLTPDMVRPLLDSSTSDRHMQNSHSPETGDFDEEGLPRVIFPLNLPTLEQMDEILINEALRRSGNNQSRAAKLLDVTPQAVSKRLRKAGPA